MPDVPKFDYLNTDLELISPQDLTPLIAAFEAGGIRAIGGVTAGGDGLWYANLETLSEEHPEINICTMLDAIESLDQSTRAIWDACNKRNFNIGYECGEEPWGFNQGVSQATIARIAAAGASLSITLYPFRPAKPSA